jgi:prophage maintenance system killer protein
MSRSVSAARLAKSAGLDPDELALALLERGVVVDDVDAEMDTGTRKAARAVAKELCGGPQVVRRARDETIVTIEPEARSKDLLGTLTVDDVLFIHDRLCVDFAQTQDPIDPPGVRSLDLLESAVARQHSGFGDELKYHDAVLNAATLLYGVCNDHPFHNGNKRTALVSMLAHLDQNRLFLESASQRDVFQLMISVAGHTIVQSPVKIGRDVTVLTRRGEPDEEVSAIADWLRCRVKRITKGEAQVTFRELRQILIAFGFGLRTLPNHKVAIVRVEHSKGLFRSRVQEKTLMAIEWPADGRVVPINHVKSIRRTLKLCEEDGVTRESFYSRGGRVDAFINSYRVVLRKLASR